MSSSFPSVSSCLSSPVGLPLFLASSLNCRRDVPLVVSLSRSWHKLLSFIPLARPYTTHCIHSFPSFARSCLIFSSRTGLRPTTVPASSLVPFQSRGLPGRVTLVAPRPPSPPWPPPLHRGTCGGISRKGIFFIALSL